MARKAVSKNEIAAPVRLADSELIVRFKSLEERRVIEEQKKIEEQSRIEKQKKTEEHVELEKRRKKSLMLVTIVFLFLVVGNFLYLWMTFVGPQNAVVVEPSTSDLGLMYVAPKYLAVGDENSVEITLSNLNLEPFNGTVTLITSTDCVTSTLDRRMSISVTELLPKDKLTTQFKIKLSKDSTVNPIDFHFLITPKDSPSYIVGDGKFLISPVPGIRSVLAWFTGASGLLALTINFLFDRFKNLLVFQK